MMCVLFFFKQQAIHPLPGGAAASSDKEISIGVGLDKSNCFTKYFTSASMLLLSLQLLSLFTIKTYTRINGTH